MKTGGVEGCRCRVGCVRGRGRGQDGVFKTWSRWWSVMSLFLSALAKQIIMWVCTVFEGGGEMGRNGLLPSKPPCQHTSKSTIISYSFAYPLLVWLLCVATCMPPTLTTSFLSLCFLTCIFLTHLQFLFSFHHLLLLFPSFIVDHLSLLRFFLIIYKYIFYCYKRF